MESKCRITEVNRNWQSGKFRLTFEVDRDVSGELEAMSEQDLLLKVVRWRKKRSLDANAYYWVLVGKIAGILKTSTTEVHNWMLSSYGQPEIIDERVMTVILLDSIDWKRIEYLHLKPTAATRTLDDGRL